MGCQLTITFRDCPERLHLSMTRAADTVIKAMLAVLLNDLESPTGQIETIEMIETTEKLKMYSRQERPLLS